MGPRELTDPLKAFNFRIALVDTSSQLKAAVGGLGLVLGGFTECAGLDASLQIEEYLEGGQNTFAHKFPSRIAWGNITLKRGITLSEDLWLWHRSFVEGKGKRRDGLIILQNDLLMPIKTWIFTRGLPLKWTGPSFNAAQSAVAIETLEIAHEGVKLASPGVAGASLAASVGLGL
jgi:phage tail-like protein